MSEGPKVLGPDETREDILLPEHVPELRHGFELWHPHIDDEPEWTIQQPIPDDRGKLSYRHASFHPAITAQLAVYHPQLMSFIEAQTNGKDATFWRLVVEEVLTNGLRHGNKADPRKRFAMRYDRVESDLVLYAKDEGEGFDVDEAYRYDPTDLENLDKACGRGIYLVRSFVCQALWSEQGNEVLVRKKVTPAS